jgi:hypothetical protein
MWQLLTWAGPGDGKFAGLMDRDELLALDKEVLVDLIVRLYDRVTNLEAGAGRPPKTSGNLSVPPSVGFRPNRAPYSPRS